MADRTLRSAAVMAAGTVLSRLLGFVRIALLAAAIGTALRGDIFTAANTIPNSLYILLAGGVFNTVLVPQLVRAIKNHDDGGQDFTNRLLTFGFVVLAVVTVGCVLLAPQIAELYMPEELKDPSRASERASMIDVRPALPAADLLLRRVRAGRPGAERAAPVRPDDVGADREQHRRLRVDRGVPADLPHRRPAGHLQPRRGAAARTRPHRGHRRTAAGAAAVSEGERAPVPAEVRSARHRAGSHRPAGHLDRAVRRGEPGDPGRRHRLAIAGSASDSTRAPRPVCSPTARRC